MHQLVNLIQDTNKAQIITLLAFDPSLVNFYTKLGFKEDGIVYFEQLPFTQMSRRVH